MIENNSLYGDMISKEEIKRRLNLSNTDPEKLVVTPIINNEQVEDGSIDLRLGTEFVLAKRSKFSSLNILDNKGEIDSKILEYQEKMYVQVGEELILHPQQFALGTTFEYVKLPVDLVGYVIGRSSWGRLGLIIATATMVHANYAGIITLELTNLGDTPIKLYPGTRISQLSLHSVGMDCETKKKKMEDAKQKQSKYQASVNPLFSRIHLDDEWGMLGKIRNNLSKQSKFKKIKTDRI